jgi:patatin-related protein
MTRRVRSFGVLAVDEGGLLEGGVPTIAIVPQEDREDLRLALVMNGGVSLAVWIGGVAMEINRLVRGEGIYGELLELTQSTARVDVVAGASAGGINGALLSTAIAHDQSLESLRSVWLDDGSLAALFRSPFQSNPPSLLKGDEYFLERLRKVFRELATTNATAPEDFPLRLMMTTTMQKGERLDFDDDFGVTLHEVIHRGIFDFRRDAAGRDDFRTQSDADRLALASRCTASFPGAFEASFVPIDSTTSDPDRPDMRGIANFSSSRYVIDGGVLVNKPVGPVLRAIFGLPADRQVRRVLAYVVPDPGPIQDVEAVAQSAVPSIAKVVMNTMSLPRQESIGLDLQELREHNRRVIGQRRIREALLREGGGGDPADPARLAGQLFGAYRDGRLDATVDSVLDQLTEGTRAIDALGGPRPHAWRRKDLKEALRSELERTMPGRMPAEGSSPEAWQWDVRVVETVGVIALDVLRQALSLAPPQEEGHRAALRDRRAELHEVLADLRRIRDDDVAYWRGQAPLMGARDDLEEPVRSAVDGWTSTVLAELAGLPRRVAEVLAAAGPTLREVVATVLEESDRRSLKTKVDGLQVPLTDAPAEVEACVRKLLELAVVQLALAAGQPELEQLVELTEINAYSKNGFDGRTKASEKLAGVQLGHFGAFYKRSWRANDWMWGRLDGADRLAQILLHPKRIAHLALASGLHGEDRREGVLSAIESVALGSDSGAREVLERWWDRDGARTELAFLATDPPGRPPTRLEVCARAVARRIQLEAIVAELPWIADAIENDREAGAYEPPKAWNFKKAVDDARAAAVATGRSNGIDPDAAVRLFSQCEVGKERISGEVRSDLFTTTATTAAAVMVSAAGGSRSGVPVLGMLLKSVRGFVLSLYTLARAAASKTGSQIALLIMLLAAGGAILAFALPLDKALPGWLTTIGIVLVLAGITLAALRAGGLATVALLVATVVLAIVPYVLLRYHYPSHWVAAKTFHALAPAAPIIALIGGSVLLGVIHRQPRPPRERPAQPAQ